MNRNQQYWARRQEMSKRALSHDALMKQHFCNFSQTGTKTTVYSDQIDVHDWPVFGNNGVSGRSVTGNATGVPLVTVSDLDSVSALFAFREPGRKIAVLNFASYKEPGGRFLDGSTAQEESLCHASNLYEVLAQERLFYAWNNQFKNRSLYFNRALYSANVTFFHPSLMPEENMTQKQLDACRGNAILADVITCAAPNKYAAQKYCGVSDAENTKALQERIRFVLDIAELNQVATLILGAYGCGVFGQDPEEAAGIFKTLLSSGRYHFGLVVFAVPGGPSDMNHMAFQNTFAYGLPR